MKVKSLLKIVLISKNSIYKDINIYSSITMNKKEKSYYRGEETLQNKKNLSFYNKNINFFNFEVNIKFRFMKYFLRTDYDRSIKISEYCNTTFGPYYYCREVKKITKNKIKKLKKDLDYIKNENFEFRKSFKGECILSPTIVVQLIERLAFSLSELFMIDNVTFSCNSNKIFDNNISLIDNPLMIHGNHHRRYDDEMMRTKKKKIINKGYINDTLSGLNLGFSKYGNVYFDELEEEKMTFSNLFLKVPNKIKKKERSIYFYDSDLPLNIDLFTGVIKGKLIGLDEITNKKIVAEFSSSYKEIFDSMKRVGRYTICNGHKVPTVIVRIGDTLKCQKL